MNGCELETFFWFSNLISNFKLILFLFRAVFTGDICSGHCCSTQTEADVLKKSVKAFEGLIRHQLKSLKGLWESTHNIYKGEVLGNMLKKSINKMSSHHVCIYLIIIVKKEIFVVNWLRSTSINHFVCTHAAAAAVVKRKNVRERTKIPSWKLLN